MTKRDRKQKGARRVGIPGMEAGWPGALLGQAIDWAELEKKFGPAAAMAACIQDPVHHAEGDVWTHARMVAERLADHGIDDATGRLAALFHDVEKPLTRVLERDATGRLAVRHPLHARLGARTAWHGMWLAGLPLRERLEAWAIIAWHQRIFHLLRAEDAERQLARYDAVGDFDRLVAFGRADNAGRICADPREAEDELLLTLEWSRTARVEMDDATRVAYLEREDRSALHVAMPPAGSRVKILSGLPGAGKDRHAARELGDLPMVSLDAIRREMGVRPTDRQGAVLQEGWERARKHLRRAEPFVWNATNLSKRVRDKITRICRNYDAHVEIHAFDAPMKTVMRRNAARPDGEAVPTEILAAMGREWEPPTRIEAHIVKWFSEDGVRIETGKKITRSTGSPDPFSTTA